MEPVMRTSECLVMFPNNLLTCKTDLKNQDTFGWPQGVPNIHVPLYYWYLWVLHVIYTLHGIICKLN